MIQRESDLFKNILLFSKALRQRKIGVTVNNILDVLRGISFIDMQDKRDFYYLLRSNFISHREEMEPFDEFFEQFWSFKNGRGPTPKKRVEEEMACFEKENEDITFYDKHSNFKIEDWAKEWEDNGLRVKREVSLYSPEELLGHKDFGHLQRDELERVKDFVLTLSRKMAIHLSRRWRRGKRGDQLDFRRSLRQSIKFGGEMIELRMKQIKPKPLRIILVCDVSGSMDIYSQFFLLFMYGLQNYYSYCQTFVFSTRLNHVTSLLKRRAFEETLHLLSQRVLDWSGGTNIGLGLHQLHQRHSELLHPNRTLFLIFSDGWDRGDEKLLDFEMKNLKGKVKRLIWLNPLLSSRHYQPLCKGMSTALPYLDHFLPCHNFTSLKNLSRYMS